MMVKFQNDPLNRDYKEIKEKGLKVKKGSIGGYSIEIEDKEFNSFISYLYRNESDRDSDLKLLKSEIL